MNSNFCKYILKKTERYGHLCEFTLVFHFRLPVKQIDGIPAASLYQILQVTKNNTTVPIESNDKLQPSHGSQNILFEKDSQIQISKSLIMNIHCIYIYMFVYTHTHRETNLSYVNFRGNIKIMSNKAGCCHLIQV